MAVSIVPDRAGQASAAGVVKGSRWYCDHYTGAPAALIAAGHISLEQLTPQAGRSPGRTAFMPDGQPCPPRVKAWREPGFKAVQQLEDGTCTVEVTVAKEVQKWRRAQVRAAEHEAKQARINNELAERGHEFRNWKLRQSFDRDGEIWEGTKAQLQGAGLGQGLSFPGEPGAPEALHCSCPLGFQFRVVQPYDCAKAAAGIFTAYSSFIVKAETPTAYVDHAPGVKREVWTPDGWLHFDKFIGSAEALVAAGLVPNLSYFPGQPGANRSQASYRLDWRTATNAPIRHELKITIRKRGRGLFDLDVPVAPEEEGRRKAIRERQFDEERSQTQALAAERRRLRQASGPQMSVDEFRRSRMKLAQEAVGLVWGGVLASVAGGLRFDISEGTAAHNRLGEALAAIRDVIATAEVVSDTKATEKAKSLVKLAAARNDKGLQSVLRSASHLRLVRGAPGEQSEMP